MNKHTCTSLLKLFNKVDNVEELATLLVYNKFKCIGRIALAKKLDISERKARNLIDKLISKNLLVHGTETCINTEVNSLIPSCSTIKQDKKLITLIKELSDELLDSIDKNIVLLRDTLIITLGNPWVFEVIGYIKGSTIAIPQTPKTIAKKYSELLKGISGTSNTLFIIWNTYKEHHHEAALILSIMKLCNHILGST
ncbi:MAG: hypothetical protein ABWW65_02995 [Thermoprotei archaeon]